MVLYVFVVLCFCFVVGLVLGVLVDYVECLWEMLIWFVVCVLVCGRFGLYCLWGCGGSSGYGWCSWCCSGCVWGDLLDCVG